MNQPSLDSQLESSGLLRTTSDLILGTARTCVIFAASALSIQGTSSAATADVALEPEVIVHDQTNSGAKAAPELSTGSAIMEVRRLSGLTWEQLSSVLGVARRSLHFWASGKPLNAGNEERVARILGCIRMIARGGARETRSLLLEVQPDGAIPLDLLSRGEYDQVVARLGPGNRPVGKAFSELSEEARAMRRPPPPEVLIDAIQDEIVEQHRPKGRSFRAARSKRKE